MSNLDKTDENYFPSSRTRLNLRPAPEREELTDLLKRATDDSVDVNDDTLRTVALAMQVKEDPNAFIPEKHRPKEDIKDVEVKDITGRNRVIGLKTNGVGVNPKDRVGASKVDFTLIPTSAKIAMALALMDGATKYGPYNWRVEPILTRTYLGGIERHLECLKESEEFARDSLIEHLGHIMAGCAILLDAASQDKLIDDRPINGKGADLIDQANEWIKTTKPEGWGR